MVIKEISLENFQCFYGQHVVRLVKGCNVFHGRNGAGKSRFFNAFNWCLNRTYYETTSGWDVHDDRGIEGYEAIASKAAVASGEKFRCEVSMAFEIDSGFAESKVRLRRFFEWESGQFSALNVRLHFVKGGEDFVVDSDEAVQEFLDRWFDPDLRKYMWVQGESIGSLIDIADSNSLQGLTRKISHWRLLESLANGARLLKNYSQNRFEEEVAASSQNTRVVSEIRGSLDAKRNEVERLVAEEEECIKRRDTWKTTEDEAQQLIDGLAQNHEKSAAVSKLKVLVSRMDSKRESINQRFEERRMGGGLLGEVGAGVDGLSVQIEGVVGKMKERKAELGLQQEAVLSLEVPNADQLKRLIEAERCEVCGTPAPEGSEALRNMKARLEEMFDLALGKGEIGRIETFQREIDEVVNFVRRQESVAKTKSDQYAEEKRKANVEWEQAVSKKEVAERELGDVVIDVGRYESSKASRDLAHREYKAEENKLIQLGVSRQTKEREIARLENKLSGLTESSGLPDDVVWKKKVAAVMAPLFQHVVEEEKKSFIRDLQAKTNLVYQDYLRDAVGVVSQIEIDPVTWAVRLPETNTANMKMAQIALMTAILMMAREKIQQHYPLIVDAPTSVMDVENTMSYIRVSGDAFDQSIIISKDYDDSMLAGSDVVSAAHKFVPLTTTGEVFDKDVHSESDLAVKIETV